MLQEKILVIILGMALVTYISRVTPFLFLPGRSFSPLVTKWLEYIPVAILASLLGPLLLQDEGSFGIFHLYFWAALPTLFVAFITKNLFITVIAGIGAAALLRFLQ